MASDICVIHFINYERSTKPLFAQILSKRWRNEINDIDMLSPNARKLFRASFEIRSALVNCFVLIFNPLLYIMSKFEIKDRIDKLIYSTYNMVADVLFSVNFDVKNIIKGNAAFRGIHAGGRCFILGTGPSLNDLSSDQLDSLKSEIVFGVNSLYKSDAVSGLMPKYYALVDNLYWETSSFVFQEVNDKYKVNPPIFLTDPRAKKIIDKLKSNQGAIYIHAKKYPVNKMSFEITSNIFGAMNVVSYSILVAMYMGFSEIYLMGCDYNAFCGLGSGHCYDDKEEMGPVSYNLAFYLKYYHITTEFHYLIAKLAMERNVKIVNLSNVSLLDAYPRQAPSVIL